jgi:hypothetical protein
LKRQLSFERDSSASKQEKKLRRTVSDKLPDHYTQSTNISVSSSSASKMNLGPDGQQSIPPAKMPSTGGFRGLFSKLRKPSDHHHPINQVCLILHLLKYILIPRIERESFMELSFLIIDNTHHK